MKPSQQNAATEVAIVTGGAKGIGFGIAAALARHGRRIALFDLDRAGLDQAASQLAASGADVIGLPVDVTKGESVDAAVEAVSSASAASTCW